ncbi:MAG: DNA-3-methyladenine glycosylase [Bacteroidota bacterium]|nr:DNA-3-methyladenine glycosylase [Bacteroidota bacterium]
MPTKLPKSFYLQTDVVSIAKQLLGKLLCTNIEGQLAKAIITETEAYNGIIDKASHAFGDRNTPRTSTMYMQGGVAYIYLCYGIHHLFNVVSHHKDIPHAVLIRAAEPIEGIEHMLERRNRTKLDRTLSAGPGTLSQALGIDRTLNGESLTGKKIWIEDAPLLAEKDIIITTRIGVDYAAEDALLPYRFYIKNSKFVSRY